MNSLTLFLPFCLILITNSPSLTNANGSDLIAQICKEPSINQKECTDILTAYPRTLHANNFLELAEAILQLSLYKAIEGQKFLKKLMRTENVPAIEQCAKSDYESVITAYKSALSKLKDDPKTAKYYAIVAGYGPVSCEGLADTPVYFNFEISNLDMQMGSLSYVATLAIDKLMGQLAM